MSETIKGLFFGRRNKAIALQCKRLLYYGAWHYYKLATPLNMGDILDFAENSDTCTFIYTKGEGD